MTWGAVAIAGATVVGGMLASSSADKSASASRDATAASVGEQRRQFDLVWKSLAPYRDIGEEGLAGLQKLMFGSPEEVQAALESRPGYQFGLQQGTKAVEAGQAAQSGLLSGRAAKEIMRFGQDYANTNYDAELNRMNNLVNIGRGAQTQGNAAALSTGQGISRAYQIGGQQQINAINQGYAGINNAVQGGIGNYMYYNTINKLIKK